METTDIETETVPSILLPCTSCNRTFRPEALAKHSKVCEKTLMRKRKQFDSSKQRLQGTEIENFVQTVPKTSRKKEAQLNLSKSKWKEKVEQARAIQAVKKPTETPLSSQVIKPSDHEECPYCGRSFGPKAYERHTEFCKEQLQKLKVSNNCNSEARERLKVRTTYRGPLTNKVLNRDRYQPNRNRDPSPLGMSSSEIYDETPKSRGLSRNSSLRSSLRSKPETTPPPPLRRTMTQINPPSKGARVSPKENNEIDSLQKTPMFNNKPRMISKEPIEKRMNPTSFKPITQHSLKTPGTQPKSPLKLNDIDVNTFKELNVISCFASDSSKSYNNSKPINNRHSSAAVQGTKHFEGSSKYILKNSNATWIKPTNDYQQMNSSVAQKLNKSETPLNENESKIITSDLQNGVIYFKQKNNHPQNEMVTSDSSKAVSNQSTSINDHHPLEIQETINCMTKSNVLKNGMVKANLQKDLFKPINDHFFQGNNAPDSINNNRHFNLSNYGHFALAQEAVKDMTSSDVSQSETDGTEVTKADYYFKSVNDNPSARVREIIELDTSSNVVDESEIKVFESKEDLKLEICSSNPLNDRNIDLTSENCKSLTEEINKGTDHTESNNRNVAFTIQFEPDNRYLVYEHHKVGHKKSPPTFKKRVSKSYESVNSFNNKENNFEGIEIQSNVTSKLEEPFKNKNFSVINTDESNSKRNCEVKTTETDDLLLLNSSLTWRERALEVMEVSGSKGNNNLNIFPNKNFNQIGFSPLSELKTVESQTKAINNSKDQFTDIDNCLSVDLELIGIFGPKEESQENFTDAFLDNDGIIYERNIKKPLSEESIIVDEKNNQNVDSNYKIATENDFLDADLYFAVENDNEIEKILSVDSLDVDRYFVEENNIADEILREEISEMDGVMEDKQFVKESDESNLFINFDNQNLDTVVDTSNVVDPVECILEMKDFNDNSQYHNDRYHIDEISEVNMVTSDSIEMTDPFVNECELNEAVGLDVVNNDQPDIFIKENDLFENVPSSTAHISNIKPEKTIKYRSLSDSEIIKKQFKTDEVSKTVEKGLDITYENEEDATSFEKLVEGGDPLTLVKDDILRIAGQEFVLMANRNKECETFGGFQMNHYCNIDVGKENMSSRISQDNNQYHGSYKPNTYCLNTHINCHKNSEEIYSDIFSHLKKSNRGEGPKMDTWQTLHQRSDRSGDYESLSEMDSLDIKFEEDTDDEFHIFQPNPVYDDSVPFQTNAFNHTFRDFFTETARYSFSSDSSKVNSEGEQGIMNETESSSEKPLSADRALPFIASKTESYGGSTSSRIPLLQSRRNYIYRSNTLPPLFAVSETAPVKCGKQSNKKKSDFFQDSKNFINDYYTTYSSIDESSEESDFDWDLSDYEAFEKKRTVFSHSSKTVYNKYYEQVEYTHESNEFQTIKTSVSNLPLPHADFFKEKEFKLPKIQTKHAPIDKKVNCKKMTDFEKLPPLRNFEGCKCSSRKEKESDEDVENRNHKFLNNSIDSAYSSLTRSSGAEGDTGKAEMSKFCHECGAKYPIAGAKFCCNCGMRRITL